MEVAPPAVAPQSQRRLLNRDGSFNVDRPRVVFLPLHWVVVHPIDEASPLHGVDAEAFRSSQAEILILLAAMDETFSQNVHVRSSYRAE